MKIEHKMIGTEHVLSLQEIYCNTVLETKEGNQIAICMRDDTVEMSVVGSGKWFRANMQTGYILEMLQGGLPPETSGQEAGDGHDEFS